MHRTTRFLDAIPHLLGRYQPCLAAHFDADIWFQQPIDDLFLLAERWPHGCVFAPDVSWFTQPFQGSRERSASYAEKIRSIRERFGGTIQGGLSCGPASNLRSGINAWRLCSWMDHLRWNMALTSSP